MVYFYIVRHGQTLLNSLDRAQGWSDSPLTEAGKQMAADIGKKLKRIEFDAVYASDMLRAVQTAKLILETGGKSGVPIEKDERLREWCLGCMESENNVVFIKNVADWLGGITSFAELNERLPDVANAIYEHDTTGMAEPFYAIESRLKQDTRKRQYTDSDPCLFYKDHSSLICAGAVKRIGNGEERISFPACI